MAAEQTFCVAAFHQHLTAAKTAELDLNDAQFSMLDQIVVEYALSCLQDAKRAYQQAQDTLVAYSMLAKPVARLSLQTSNLELLQIAAKAGAQVQKRIKAFVDAMPGIEQDVAFSWLRVALDAQARCNRMVSNDTFGAFDLMHDYFGEYGTQLIACNIHAVSLGFDRYLHAQT